jgi:hypothetical protein
MNTKATKDVRRIFAEEGHLIDEALRKGVRAAILLHKKARQPVVIYRDGKIVWVDPKELGA